MNEYQLSAFAQIVSTAIKETNGFHMGNLRSRQDLEEIMKVVAKAVTSDPYGSSFGTDE